MALAQPALVLAESSACGPQDSVSKERRLANHLRWETKSEIQSVGFEIFRSTAIDGKFTKVNDNAIPAAKFSASLRKYEFVDDSIDPCLSYFYYVEAIGERGNREKVSPTMAANPKVTAASP